ncbi:hypothetical protein A5742_14350 [Mycolicibacterium fortuitum]|uniref:Uncharacterized protein n=1 Tax=Mycolicibacterium fortuitum TaxID=1766 RepID=A0ABD6QD18_MYCFO|nr:hypothetical protein A5742_14350 [Mycolicibacterium fortuitum]
MPDGAPLAGMILLRSDVDCMAQQSLQRVPISAQDQRTFPRRCALIMLTIDYIAHQSHTSTH